MTAAAGLTRDALLGGRIRLWQPRRGYPALELRRPAPLLPPILSEGLWGW